MSPRQVAELVHRDRGRRIHHTTVVNWALRGVGGHRLRASRIGGVWDITEADLKAFLEAVERAAVTR